MKIGWKRCAASPLKRKQAAEWNGANASIKPGSLRLANGLICYWMKEVLKNSINLCGIAAPILGWKNSAPPAMVLLQVSGGLMAGWFMFSRRTLQFLAGHFQKATL